MHTHGPWHEDDGAIYGTRKDEPHLLVRVADTYNEVDDIPTEESDANAIIIAAAPELLESLRDIVNFLHSHKSLPQGNLFHMNAATLLARIEEAAASV